MRASGAAIAGMTSRDLAVVVYTSRMAARTVNGEIGEYLPYSLYFLNLISSVDCNLIKSK